MTIFTYKAHLFNDTRNEYHHGCSLVIKNIFSFFNKLNVDIIKTFPSGTNHLHNANLENFIKNVDIIIVNGEGTIHHSQINDIEKIKINNFLKISEEEKELILIFLKNAKIFFNDLVKEIEITLEQKN